MKIKFDIIIPVYNGEFKLSKMINSIVEVRKNYDDFNVIIVNDGSEDNTLKICKEYEKSYSFIKIINQKNSGPSIARKNGFKKSNGEYILFCDADDYMHPNILEVLNEILIEKQTDIIEFGFNYLDENGKKLKSKILKEENLDKEILKHYLIQKNTTNYLWNKVIKRNIIDESDFVKLYYSEDACALIKIFSRCKKYITISDVLYNYVLSAQSACGSEFSEKHLDIVRADNIIYKFVSAKDSKYTYYVSAAACSHAAILYVMLFDANFYNENIKNKIINHFKKYYKILQHYKINFNEISYKRYISVKIFNISPKIYYFALRKFIKRC